VSKLCVSLLRSLSFRLKERNGGNSLSPYSCSLSIDQNCFMFTKFETVHDVDTTHTSLQGAVGEELQVPLNNLRHLNNWTKWQAWRLHSSWRSDGISTVVGFFLWRMKTPPWKFWFSDSTLQFTASPQTNNTPRNVRYVKASCHARTLFLSHEVKKGKDKVAPIFPKEHFFLEDFQPLAFLISDKCSMWMKLSVERWWNDTGRKKSKHSENN
jgi:hypothetical protein